LGKQADIVVIGVSLAVGLSVYLGMWALMPGGTQIMRDFVSYIAIVYPRRSFRKNVEQ
jgi:hypothetical protein